MDKIIHKITARHQLGANRKALLVSVLFIATAHLTIAQAQQTSLLSINRTGTGSGNYDSYIGGLPSTATISADNRFVVFASVATDLVSLPVSLPTSGTQVYVRDLVTGTTKLVSINRDGTAGGNRGAGAPSISADGRFVSFESGSSDLVANDTNRHSDVFVRDLATGTTTLVSVNRAGTASGDAPSFYPQMSGDGRTIVFLSHASDLVANDTNNAQDLFTRDLATGVTACVNVSRAGVPTGNRTRLTHSGSFDFHPVISADGRYVAFMSYLNDLVENDTLCRGGSCDGMNGINDIFVRDLAMQKTILVSVNRAGTNGGNGGATNPSISADGRRVAFRSFSTDLVNNDTTPQADIYVRDLAAGTTVLVSVNRAGTNGGGAGYTDGAGINSHYPLISPDGQYVAFGSWATDLALNKTNVFPMDVFVRDLAAGVTTLASVNRNGDDSRRANNISSIPQAFSRDGRFIIFNSNASDLVEGDTNNDFDGFIRDLAQGTTTAVNSNLAGRTSSSGASRSGASRNEQITADGRMVIFESASPDIVDGDTNNTWDIFARKIGSPPTVTAEVRTWTLEGRTQAYVRLTLPDGSYRVADWGRVTNAGAEFFADARVERVGGNPTQIVTNDAHIYDLGVLAPGTYTFTFRSDQGTAQSINFTVGGTSTPNLVDGAREFVRQQYRDFLQREPDTPGWNFWTNEITECTDASRWRAGESEARCIDRKRVNTSGAFFLSLEHQATGYYVYRLYNGALGRVPLFAEYLPDTIAAAAGIVVNNQLVPATIDANKLALAKQFVQRPEFLALYPETISNDEFLTRLTEKTRVALKADERAALLAELNGTGARIDQRASVVLKIVDGQRTELNTQGRVVQTFTNRYAKEFYDREYNPAFVQMQYFGYLRRDPDANGYQFWRAKLNHFGNFIDAEMVRAFILAAEYRSRFGQP